MEKSKILRADSLERRERIEKRGLWTLV